MNGKTRIHGVLYCDSCQSAERMCQLCGNCSCDAYYCEHQQDPLVDGERLGPIAEAANLRCRREGVREMTVKEFIEACRARGWHFTANSVQRRYRELTHGV